MKRSEGSTIKQNDSQATESRKDIASMRDSFRTLLALTWQHRKVFAAGLVALAIGSGINLLLPEVVRRALDPKRFQELSDNLTAVVLVLVALFVIQGCAFFVRSYLFGLVGQRVYADLRERLFASVLSKEIAFFDTARASDLASRLNSDAALVQEAVSVKLSVFVRYSFQVLVGVALMLCMSWRLTLAIVAAVILLVGSSTVFISKLRASSRSYQNALASFTSFASEVFSGVKIARVLGANSQLNKQASKLNIDTLKLGERRIAWGAGFSSGASAALNILLLMVAWYGIALTLSGELAFNELAAFVLYGAIVAVSFSFLIGAYGDLAQGLGGLERCFQLIKNSHDYEQAGYLKHAPLIEDKISGANLVFSDVTFSYPGRDELKALDKISFEIKAGSFTAFVGPSGSGKSTIAQLICNLYKPSSGTISISGAPLSSLSEDSLREKVAWVAQEPTLFGFTILENLLLGNGELLRDEALKLLQGWDFLDFVETLESGYDTKLGEFGTLLSGGQRQRLAIARALLRKPAVLILDEATSGLDSETEMRVMRAVRDFIPQATLVVISHRLSTVCNADMIYVITEGTIVQSGTHDELSRVEGVYQRYSERQELAIIKK
jgi:ABC-type multidrug transport system fused ATPase/permease subunit